MQRLTLSEFAITILFLLALVFGASYLLHSWLLQVQSETSGRIERAGKVWP